MLGYYGCEAEVRGHVAGIMGRARRSGKAHIDLLNYDIETIMMNAINRGFEQQELIPVLQKIAEKWYNYLNKVMEKIFLKI